MQKIILPYFHPLSAPVKVGSTSGTRISAEESEKLGNEMEFSVTMADFEHLSVKSALAPYGKLEYWPLLVVDSDLPRSYFEALVHLLSGRWTYRLDRTIGNGKLPTNILRFNKSLLKGINAGIELGKNKRFQIAMERWGVSFSRDESLDSVLDCCSALEALFQFHNELRLRLALATYHTLDHDKRSGFRTVYQMYKFRSEFVHGSKIPDLNDTQRAQYIDVTSKVLKTLLKSGALPSSSEIAGNIEAPYN